MKTISFFKFAVLSTAMVFGLAACGPKEPAAEPGQNEEPQEEPEPVDTKDKMWVFYGSDAIVAGLSSNFHDLRIDDQNTNFFIWESTGIGANVSETDVNYKGQAVGGFMGLTITAGWFGAAFNHSLNALGSDMNFLKRLNPDIDDAYMHIALKSSDNQQWRIQLKTSNVNGNETGVEWVVGVGTATGNNVIALPRDGQWHEFNLNLGDAGAVFGKFTGGNPNSVVFAAWDFDVAANSTLYFDGIYVYGE